MGQDEVRRGARWHRTHERLLAVAQQLLASGRTEVPVLEITTLAGVGLGSFYNHFASKEELFTAGLDAAAHAHAARLRAAAGDTQDPAALFAANFRRTGRYFRAEPNLTRALVMRCAEYYSRGRGLVASLRSTIDAGVACGRFSVHDPEAVVGTVVGALAMLGERIHGDPGLDEAAVTDALCADLLGMLGLSAAEVDQLAFAPMTP